MAKKKYQVILPEFHWRKLEMIKKYTGLGTTGIIERWIEGYKMVEQSGSAPPDEIAKPLNPLDL